MSCPLLSVRSLLLGRKVGSYAQEKKVHKKCFERLGHRKVLHSASYEPFTLAADPPVRYSWTGSGYVELIFGFFKKLKNFGNLNKIQKVFNFRTR
jgi:hypothetical protein